MRYYLSEIIVHYQKFFRFLLVGALTAGIYFIFFVIAYDLLYIVYYVSQTIAFAISVVFQYIANRFFTFGYADKAPLSQIIKYSIVLFINYIISIAITCLFVEWAKLSPYIGILGSVVVTVFLSFNLNRLWVFKRKGDEK